MPEAAGKATPEEAPPKAMPPASPSQPGTTPPGKGGPEALQEGGARPGLGQTDRRLPSLLRRRNIVLFFLVVFCWMVFDRVTKGHFDGAYGVGEVASNPIIGLFRFVLVHNTGGAWGVFDSSTLLLAVVSAVVCVLLLGYFLVQSPKANAGEVLGLALIFAGGLGNGIDRFVFGYVVDFIEFTFVAFPVFNIADMGITCGFPILIISMLMSLARDRKAHKQASGAPEGPEGS